MKMYNDLVAESLSLCGRQSGSANLVTRLLTFCIVDRHDESQQNRTCEGAYRSSLSLVLLFGCAGVLARLRHWVKALEKQVLSH